jgi:hypothetical protein
MTFLKININKYKFNKDDWRGYCVCNKKVQVEIVYFKYSNLHYPEKKKILYC